MTANLTPAGLQVEQAIAMGYTAAAFNLYHKNLQDDVPMVEGDAPHEVSVWSAWHRMIQQRIGEGQTVGEALVEKHGLRGAAEMLGVFHDPAHPDDTLAEIEGELLGSLTPMEALHIERDADGRATKS